MNQVPVVLKNIRIHGIGDVIDSSWFEIGNALTYFFLPDSFNRSGFLEALQSVSPPYDCREVVPFAGYPRITRQGKYQKRVRPERRTIAFMIFTAQVEFIRRLALITPLLYDTDRIEVGRRLDYSRWINFVEIASSTRWSEIENDVFDLVARCNISFESQIGKIILQRKGAERITGQLRERIDSWLEKIGKEEKNSDVSDIVEKLRFAVQRQEHFFRAKEIVEENLPIFFIINDVGLMQFIAWLQDFGEEHCLELPFFDSSYRNSSHLRQKLNHQKIASMVSEIKMGRSVDSRRHGKIGDLRHAVEYCIVLTERVLQRQPIFLFDEPSLSLSAEDISVCRQYVEILSQRHQCVYLTADREIFERTESATILTLQDLEIRRGK